MKSRKVDRKRKGKTVQGMPEKLTLPCKHYAALCHVITIAASDFAIFDFLRHFAPIFKLFDHGFLRSFSACMV